MKALTSVVRDMQDMSLLAAAFPGIVYLEASQGIVSKRRLPRVSPRRGRYVFYFTLLCFVLFCLDTFLQYQNENGLVTYIELS